MGTQRVRTVPAILADHPPGVSPASLGMTGVNGTAVWVQATRRIPAGRELLVDYGPEWRAVVATRTRTAPALC